MEEVASEPGLEEEEQGEALQGQETEAGCGVDSQLSGGKTKVPPPQRKCMENRPESGVIARAAGIN